MTMQKSASRLAWQPLRPVARAAAVLLTALLYATSCTEGPGGGLTDPGERGVRVGLVPQYNYSGAASAPIVRARLTILRQPANDTLFGPVIQSVDPNAANWDLKVQFELPAGVTSTSVVVLVELLSDTGIEWSGKTAPITVSPATQTQPKDTIQLYQGPPANLEVQGIEITTAPASLLEGDSTQLVAIVSPAGRGTVFWSSLDPAVGAVSATGVVRALRDGALRIRASAGPREDTVSIAVGQRPASVRIQPDTARAASVNATVNFTAAVLDPRGAPIAGATVTWSSQHPAIAESQGSGQFVTRSNGTATVVATSTTAPGVSGTARLVVAQQAASVQLVPGLTAFDALGVRAQFVATALDANGHTIAGAAFTWSSSNPGVATVDGAGNVQSVGNGTATITATAASGSSAAVEVSVAQTLAAVQVTPAAHTFTALGDSTRFTARGVDRNGNPMPGSPAWSSANSAIVSIDDSGMVRAVATGTTQVRATIGSVTGSADVTVAPVFTRLEISPATDTLRALGATAAFTARGFDRNGNAAPATPTWSSSEPGVATIDGAGTATAVANGTTTITARTGDVTATAVLVVLQRAAAVEIQPDSLLLAGAGASAAFTAIVRDARGAAVTGAPVAWTSLDPATATVDDAGLVTGVRRGTARIVASSGSATDTARAIVAGTTVEITPDTLRLSASFDTASFTAVVRNAAGQVLVQRITWTSLAPSVVTVDSAGKVTALNPGTARVVAAAADAADTAVVVFAPVVRRVTIAPALDTVFVGHAISLSAEALDSRGIAVPAEFVWSSSDPAIATVDQGAVTGVMGGVAQISATAGGVTGTATVLVVGAPDLAMLTLNVTPADTITPGDSIFFQYAVGNQGTQASPPTQLLLRSVDAATSATLYDTIIPVPALEPGSTFGGTVARRVDPVASLPASIRIVAMVDPLNSVAEANESNNVRETPAVVVRGVTPPPTGAIPADHVLLVGQSIDLLAPFDGATWTVDAYWVAQVDTAGVVVAQDHGAVHVIATNGMLADTTVIWVLPAGVTHIWVGDETRAPAWSDPANWHNADVPGAGDDVLVPDCNYFRTACVYPYLTAAAAVRSLVTGVPDYYYYDNVVAAAERFRAVRPSLRAPALQQRARADARRDSLEARRNTARAGALARNVKRIQREPRRMAAPAVSPELSALRNMAASLEMEYWGHVQLGTHSLDISGFVDMVTITSEDGSGNVRLSGTEQRVRGIDVYGSLEITGTVHVGSSGDYCGECYYEYYPGGDVYGPLTVSGNAIFNGYVNGEVNVTGSLAVSDWLYTDSNVTFTNAPLRLWEYSYVETYGNLSTTGSEIEMRGWADLEVYGSIFADGTAILLNNGYIEVGDWSYDYDDSDVDGEFRLTNGASLVFGVYGWVYAYGDFNLLSNASISMDVGDGSPGLYVYGNATFDGASTEGALTSGYMYFYGDLTVGNSSSPTAYAPTGAHETGFGITGPTGLHVVSMANPGPAGNRFAHVYGYTSGDTLRFLQPAWITGGAYLRGRVEAGIIDVVGYLGTYDAHVIATEVRAAGSIDAWSGQSSVWEVDRTIVAGGSTAYVTLEALGDVEVTGSPILEYVTATGTLLLRGNAAPRLDYNDHLGGTVVVDENAVLEVTGSSNEIVGSLETRGSGRLVQSGGLLTITGSANFTGAANTLAGGILAITGNLSAAAGRFGASGTHETRLIGTAGEQTLSVADPFQKLFLANPSGVHMLQDITVNDVFAATYSGVRADAVHHIRAKHATISNFTASRVWLDLGEATGPLTLSLGAVTFSGFQSTDIIPAQLRITAPAMSIPGLNITFDIAHTGRFVDINFTGATLELTGAGPAPDGSRFTGTGTVTYNGSQIYPPTQP